MKGKKEREFTWVVGVDVAQETLTAAIAKKEWAEIGRALPVMTITNNPQGYQVLLEWLKNRLMEMGQTRMILEHTGTYWTAAASFFYTMGMQVVVALPKRVCRYREALPPRGKTDAQDACVLAYFGLAIPTTLWEPPDPCYRELREILRVRLNLKQQQTNLQNAYRSLQRQKGSSDSVLNSLKNLGEQLQHSAEELLEQAKTLVQRHPHLQEVVEILRSIPGVGWVTALGVLGELQGIQSFHHRKSTCAYAGVVPYSYESGTSVRKKPHISRESNHYLRYFLFAAANSGSRCNPKLKPFYQRLLDKGHSKTSAKIACARKLLTIILACVQHHQFFDPDYVPEKLMMAT